MFPPLIFHNKAVKYDRSVRVRVCVGGVFLPTVPPPEPDFEREGAMGFWRRCPFRS